MGCFGRDAGVGVSLGFDRNGKVTSVDPSAQPIFSLGGLANKSNPQGERKPEPVEDGDDTGNQARETQQAEVDMLDALDVQSAELEMLNNLEAQGRRDTVLNNRLARSQKSLVGKPYVLTANGPNAYDCSGAVCHGIRRTGNSNFGDYTADQLYNNFTKGGDGSRGNLIFYDYNGDGNIQHVTTILNTDQMIHPSSGKGVIQQVPRTWLNNYTSKRGGTSYIRSVDWDAIK